MAQHDFPNIYYVHYLRRLQSERMSPASALAMLTEAFNRDEIDKGELLRLMEIRLDNPPINAPGGDA